MLFGVNTFWCQLQSFAVFLSVRLSSFSFSPETRRQKEVRPEGNSSVTSFLLETVFLHKSSKCARTFILCSCLHHYDDLFHRPLKFSIESLLSLKFVSRFQEEVCLEKSFPHSLPFIYRLLFFSFSLPLPFPGIRITREDLNKRGIRIYI